MTVASREHGLEDAQVQSVLHAALAEAKNEGREVSTRAFARHLERTSEAVEAQSGEIPARQLESLRTRLADGAQAENMPDGHRRAAVTELNERCALAKRQLDGFIDDASVRYGESAEKTQARYAQARAEAVTDRSLEAPDTFVTGLQKGAFTWGAPRDRATAYALHKVAEGLGYRPTGSGSARCPECGEFMGEGHACAPETATQPEAQPVKVASETAAASQSAWVTGDGWDDDEDDKDGYGNDLDDDLDDEPYEDMYAGMPVFYDPNEHESRPYVVVDTFEDGENGPEIAVTAPAAALPTAGFVPPEDAVVGTVSDLRNTVDNILSGNDQTGAPVLVAGDIVGGGRGLPGGGGGFVAGQIVGGGRGVPVAVNTPPLSLDQEMETFADLAAARERLDDTVAQMETALAARLDADNIREFTDDTTGVTVSPVGGVRYSEWDKERAISDVAAKIAERDGLAVDDVRAVVTDYASFASVDRFRTRQLRSLGLRAGDYATATPEPRALELAYADEPSSPPTRAEGLAYRFRQGMTGLNSRVSTLNASVNNNRLAAQPVAEAVRELAATKRLQSRLAEASEQVEDRMIARMTGQRVNNLTRSGRAIGAIHTPSSYRTFDVDRINTDITEKIAARTGKSRAIVEDVVGKFGEVAPITKFRVRQLATVDMDANNYGGPSDPRPRIRWNSA